MAAYSVASLAVVLSAVLVAFHASMSATQHRLIAAQSELTEQRAQFLRLRHELNAARSHANASLMGIGAMGLSEHAVPLDIIMSRAHIVPKSHHAPHTAQDQSWTATRPLLAGHE